MVVVLGAAAGLALGLAACGGGSSSSATGVSTTIHVPAKPKTAAKAQPKKSNVSPPKSVRVTCPGEVGIFVGAMEGLRRELEIGLSYEQYAGEVDTIRKDYDRIPVKKLSLSCLSAAATPGERAFDRYVAAANTWNACASEPSCGSSQIEAGLQKEWRVAAHFLGEAKKGLR
jgi:hypothetical protein